MNWENLFDIMLCNVLLQIMMEVTLRFGVII